MRPPFGATVATVLTEQGSRVPSARVRAPPADTGRASPHQLRAEFPGPSLVKKQSSFHGPSASSKRVKNRTPHLALGAGGAIDSLHRPDVWCATRTPYIQSLRHFLSSSEHRGCANRAVVRRSHCRTSATPHLARSSGRERDRTHDRIRRWKRTAHHRAPFARPGSRSSGFRRSLACCRCGSS